MNLISNLRKVGSNARIIELGKRVSLFGKVHSKGCSMSVVKEGKAEIVHPKSVFYNPVQEFNRDLTIAVISEFVKDHFTHVQERAKKQKNRNKGDNSDGNVPMKSEVENDEMINVNDLKAGTKYENGVKILEGLAASGLRSMRFGLEIPGVKHITANDFDASAVEIIKENIKKNQLDHLVSPNEGDAAIVMYQNKNFSDRFDVIDLDPYGTASPFLDAAVQAVRDGGLLCITCTDCSILCGNAGEKCYALYGAMPLKTKYCHEMALRIVLQCIMSHASRYSRYIVPVISVSTDFYVRVFVKVYTGAAKVKHSVTKLAMVYHCVGCGTFNLQKIGHKTETKDNNFKFTPATGPAVKEHCDHCGCKHQLGGPIYVEQLHDQDFVDRVLDNVRQQPDRFKTSEKIIGMLSMISEELPDTPLYYVLDGLCNIIHCDPPTLIGLRSAVLNAGYRVSMSHTQKNSIQTDAPASVIWDIMRAWVKLRPVSEKRLQANSPGRAILEKEPTMDVSFEVHDDANPKSRKQGLKRYAPNPEKFWGPKPRARKADDGETLEERREKNQDKRKRRRINAKGETEIENQSQTNEGRTESAAPEGMVKSDENQ